MSEWQNVDHPESIPEYRQWRGRQGAIVMHAKHGGARTPREAIAAANGRFATPEARRAYMLELAARSAEVRRLRAKTDR